MSWWNANSTLPFPQEFAVAGASEDPGAIVHDLRTVELHGSNCFRWQQSIFASVSELRRELLDHWHEQIYPVLDESGLAERCHAAAAMAAPQPMDESALRELVWQRGPAAAAATPSPLPAALLRLCELRVDVLGGVIGRDAAPQSLCSWEPSPCFPLARGGLRVLANLVPLHSAAHRDRENLLLAALIREVAVEGRNAAAGPEAGLVEARGEAARDGSSGRGAVDSAALVDQQPDSTAPTQAQQQQQQRVFVVVARKTPAGSGGGDGGGRGDEGEARAELRQLHGGAPPSAVSAIWEFVRAALAAGGARPGLLPTPSWGPGEAGAAAVESDAAAEAAAEVDAMAAALLQDLLCTNWVGLREGMLVRSLPYRQLQTCGGGGAAAGRQTSTQRPEAAAAVAGLLVTYLSCTATAGAAATDGTTSSGQPEREQEGAAEDGGQGTGPEVRAGVGEASGLMRRARAALASALGWKPTGRPPGLEDLLLPSPPTEDNVGVGAELQPAGTDEGHGDAGAAGGPAAASAGTAKTVGGTGEASPARQRLPPGLWAPKVRRPAPLSPRHPRPLRRPNDYVLWPTEPQPAARWVLVDGDTLAVDPAEAQEHAEEGEGAAAEGAAAAAALKLAAEESEVAAVAAAAGPDLQSVGDGAAAVGGKGDAQEKDTGISSGAGGSGLETEQAAQGFKLPASRLFPTSTAAGGRGPGSSEGGGQPRHHTLSCLTVEDVEEAESAMPGTGREGHGLATTANEEETTAAAEAGEAATGGTTRPGQGSSPGAAVAGTSGVTLSPEKAERARRAARRRTVLQQVAAEAAASRVRSYPASAGAAGYVPARPPSSQHQHQQAQQWPPPPPPQPPLVAESGRQTVLPERQSGSGGGASKPSGPSSSRLAALPAVGDSGVSAGSPAVLQLPGLRHLEPEAAASLEQQFAEAAAAAASSCKRSYHLRSVLVKGGTAAAVTAPPPLLRGMPPGMGEGRAAAPAATAAQAGAGSTAAIPSGTVVAMSAADSPRSSHHPVTAPVTPADADAKLAAASEPAAPPLLPGLLQLPPEAAASLEAAFREAAASSRRNYHLRSARAAGPAPPPPPAAAAAAALGTPRSPAEDGGGARNGGSAAPGAAWGPGHPSPHPSPRLAPAYLVSPTDGVYTNYYEQYIEQEDGSYVAAAALEPSGPDRVARCFGFMDAAGHVTWRNEEQELRVQQYRTFVRLTQESRPTGRGAPAAAALAAARVSLGKGCGA